MISQSDYDQSHLRSSAVVNQTIVISEREPDYTSIQDNLMSKL